MRSGFVNRVFILNATIADRKQHSGASYFRALGIGTWALGRKVVINTSREIKSHSIKVDRLLKKKALSNRLPHFKK